VFVYPVERVFLAEIRGKDDRLYAVPLRNTLRASTWPPFQENQVETNHA